MEITMTSNLDFLITSIMPYPAWKSCEVHHLTQWKCTLHCYKHTVDNVLFVLISNSCIIHFYKGTKGSCLVPWAVWELPALSLSPALFPL